MELLCLPASGSSVRQLQVLSSKITNACSNVPNHVRELAALPADSHRERALHRWAHRQPWRGLLPAEYPFEIPYTPDGVRETTSEHFAFLPHELFAKLSECPELLAELLTGPPGNLDAFWRSTAETQWCQRHPLPEIHTNPGRCVPIGLHGDDAGVFGNQKVLVLTWGSVARELLTLDGRFLFCAMTYAHVAPGKTIEVLYEVLVWSLLCLAEGVYPTCDHCGRPFSETYHPDRWHKAGKPLSRDGYRGVWSELRGDWKWQAEALALEHWYGKNFICHLCRAHRRIKRLFFTQFRQTDHIRRTLVSSAMFRDWYGANRSRPALTRILGFDVWRCWADAMHVLDLGVYQVVAAACLIELVEEMVWGSSDDRGFKLAHVEYKGWCKETGVEPCPRFDKSKLAPTKGEFPHFSQQLAKASQTRYLMRWLRSVLDKPGVSSGTYGGIRFMMMKAFMDFEDVCDRNGRFLAHPDRQSIARHMETALLCMNSLSCRALDRGKFMWHLIPKCHMATHLAYDFAASGVNPRRVTCYADEDMVGKVKKIVTRCHGVSAGRTCLQRYAILVGTRWWTRLAELRGVRG